MKVAFLATSALVGTLLMSTSALAQSTGTAEVEANAVIVTAAKKPAIAGVVAETAPKARTTINQDYISQRASGQTILQTLNLTPGLNFTNNDPYGSSGGNIRLRGFDGARISLTFDGIPLNDTGNYAIYSNQQLDPELISQANVITGATDVDTPTISSTGGVINYTVRRPSKDMGGLINASVGSFDYGRIFGLIDSGEFGPWGTRAYIAGSYQNYNKFKGTGQLEKKQINGMIFQDLPKPGDYIDLAFNYNENRNAAIYAPNLGTTPGIKADGTPGATVLPSEISTLGWGVDYNSFAGGAAWTQPQARTGIIDPDVNTSFWRWFRINPSNTGNVRLNLRYTIMPGLTLTVDPSFQYVLANGGTQTSTLTEGQIAGAHNSGTDQLIGQGGSKVITSTCVPAPPGGASSVRTGVDLNGDGDACDTVRYFSPSNTNTRRYGVNSSLIWKINDDNTLRLAYTYDDGHHRQTGEGSYISTTDGKFSDWFGGKDGHAAKIYGADGSFIRFRDRASIADLNQVALEYRGRFLEDHLELVLGVQHKQFDRHLNQFCYTLYGTSTVLCTTATPSTTLANGDVRFASSTTNEYIPPFRYHAQIKKTLPNLGVQYRFDAANSMYFSYSEQISALKTDSYYTVQRNSAGAIQSLNAQPEATKTYELGYRYQTPTVNASAAIYQTNFNNRVVSTYDPDTDTYHERNVGSVLIRGAEGQITFTPIEHLYLRSSVTYTDAKYQNALLVLKGATRPLDVYAPINGKQLVETPKWMLGESATYTWGDLLVGADVKYVGKRFATDMNDLVVKAYTTVDVNARYKLDRFGLEGSSLQLNVWNIFDKNYIGSLSTQVTANPLLKTQYNVTSQPSGYIGAPRTVQLSLRVAF